MIYRKSFTRLAQGLLMLGLVFGIAHSAAAAPSAVVASDGTSLDEVALTFNGGITGAATFDIYRSTGTSITCTAAYKIGTKAEANASAGTFHDSAVAWPGQTITSVATPGVLYRYAVGLGGVCSTNADFGYRAPPAPPTNLKASDGLTGFVNVSWDVSATDASGIPYLVQRRLPGGTWSTMQTNILSTVYIDNSATPGVTYEYQAQAKSGGGEFYSAFSNSDTGFMAVTPSPTPTVDNLSVSRIGSGSVTFSPIGMGSGTTGPCGSGGSCLYSYNSGTSVTLTPTAGTGYTFTGWSGACSGSGSCTVLMDGTKIVTANFTAAATAITNLQTTTGSCASGYTQLGTYIGGDGISKWKICYQSASAPTTAITSLQTLLATGSCASGYTQIGTYQGSTSGGNTSSNNWKICSKSGSTVSSFVTALQTTTGSCSSGYNLLGAYRGSDGTSNWKICFQGGSAAPTASFAFSLGIDFGASTASSWPIEQGKTTSLPVIATLSSGSTQAVTFSISGLPSGVTASWSKTSCSPTCTSTLTLTASASAALTPTPPKVTVSAVGGGMTKTSSFNLAVVASGGGGTGGGTAPACSAADFVGSFIPTLNWADPTGTPPANNAVPPINVGTTKQKKCGDLDIVGVLDALGLRSETDIVAPNGDVIARGVTLSSDLSLKKEVSPLSDALNKVLDLRGVSFQWRADGDNAKTQLGVIAQEVEKVYPEVVTTNATTGLKSVNYPALIAPLIEAIKTQQQEINQLQVTVKQLQQQIASQ